MEMKKVAVVWSSPNTDGLTASAKDQFIKGLTDAGADGIVWISAVYWSDLTECFKAFFDRLRRCDAGHNHLLAEKRCVLIACAGGTGRGTMECLTQLERGMTHMGIRVYDRVSVVRYNKDYILPALYSGGKTYADRLETGFDMYY